MHVLIAGAGPAGASLSIQLAKAGWDVTLADALPTPERNAYSSAALPLTDADRLLIPEACRSASWWGWQLLDPNGLEHQWWAALPQGVVLDFAMFRTHLWDRARRTGVQLLNGCRVRLDRLGSQSAEVMLSSAGEEQHQTVDLVVDATGPGRHLQRQTGVAVESTDDPLLSGDGVEWLLQGDSRSTARWREVSFMLGHQWMPHGAAGCSRWRRPAEGGCLPVGTSDRPKVPLGEALDSCCNAAGWISCRC